MEDYLPNETSPSGIRSAVSDVMRVRRPEASAGDSVWVGATSGRGVGSAASSPARAARESPGAASAFWAAGFTTTSMVSPSESATDAVRPLQAHSVSVIRVRGIIYFFTFLDCSLIGLCLKPWIGFKLSTVSPVYCGLTFRSSTSKIRGAFGGIGPPGVPVSPYARSEGI